MRLITEVPILDLDSGKNLLWSVKRGWILSQMSASWCKPPAIPSFPSALSPLHTPLSFLVSNKTKYKEQESNKDSKTKLSVVIFKQTLLLKSRVTFSFNA